MALAACLILLVGRRLALSARDKRAAAAALETFTP
jgi:hypothetical protein